MLPGRHVTTCAAERNWSAWGLVYTKTRNRLGIERAEKLVFIAGNKGSAKQRADEEVVMQLLSATVAAAGSS